MSRMAHIPRADVIEQIISAATTFRRVNDLGAEATVLVVWPEDPTGFTRAGLQRSLNRLDRHITLTAPG